MHPEVANEDVPGDQLRVECVDCHADYHVYPYDPYEHYFNSDYYWHYPRFGYYYGYPWWWDDYYWYYYFSPDDPSVYPSTTRDVDRPAYRGGGIPTRSPGGYDPGVVNSRGTNVLPPREPNIPPVAPGDTTGSGDTPSGKSKDAMNILPPEDRTIGQPPWQKPTGGIKPPKLRDDVESETKKDESKPATIDSGAIKTSQPAKPPDKKETESDEEKKKEAEPRGKPKRTPR
jgi:hypothetical protein